MKYMLLIYGNDETWNGWSRADYDEVMRAHREVIADLTESGELVDTKALTTLDAKTVRVRSDVPAVTDGPYAEAKELLAGYYLVDCETIDRAAEIASRLPEARYNLVEVRRVMEDCEFG